MQILKRWFKHTAVLLVGLALSLGLCAAARAPESPPPQWLATLPAGNAVKDPRSLLRMSLPIDNTYIRQVQNYLDGTSPQLRGKRWGDISRDISKATAVVMQHKAEILADIPEAKQAEAETWITDLQAGLVNLKEVVQDKSPESFKAARASVLTLVGSLEAAMVTQFPFEVPEEYSHLPQLKGRATVVLETTQGPITITVDGYSAPVTAGNFVDLVQRGFYDDMPITRAEEFYVVQTGDPEGPADGFIDPDTGEYRSIPLEILVEGDKEPIYEFTLEEMGLYEAHPVLPFSAYGTVAMACPSDNPNGGSSQFFFLLFEPELTPAGSNLLDGRYAVFGYTLEGQEALGELTTDDKIISAKVVQGAENLV